MFQHKDAYQVILDGVKGGPKEKRLAAQFIPKFFSSFPDLADAAINAQLDLCEDEDVSVRSSLAPKHEREKTPIKISRDGLYRFEIISRYFMVFFAVTI